MNKIIVINLNSSDKEYDFNLSAISQDVWSQLVHDIIIKRVPSKNNLKINGAKIVIRDNKAKIKLFYQDSNYHEVQFLCDEFGRLSQQYIDSCSILLQDVMTKLYGNKYTKVLDKKLNILNVQANKVD